MNIDLITLRERIGDEQIPDDLAHWLNNQQCNLFEDLGLRLLSDNEINAFVQQDPASFESHANYFAFTEIQKDILLVAKNKENLFFGYWRHNNTPLINAPLVSLGKDDVELLYGNNIIEALLISLADEEENAYNTLKKRFEAIGFHLDELPSIIRRFDEQYDTLIDPEELFYDYQKGKGRPLTHLNFEVKKDDFLEWHSPRYGTDNPTQVDSNFWKQAIAQRHCAYTIEKKYCTEDSFKNYPIWCFERYGQSLNKVNGKEIPKDIFPPTDFHTATLVDEETLLIIGSLGYSKDRQTGITPVYSLNINSFQITKVNTTGENPGWIYEHRSIVSKDNKTVKITGGIIQREHLWDNLDEWELDLQTSTWSRLSHITWPRWKLTRTDRKRTNFSEIRFLEMYKDNKDYTEKTKTLSNTLGFNIDEHTLENFYVFNEITSYKVLTETDEYNIFQVSIDDIVVTFEESSSDITVTVQGALDPNLVTQLQELTLQKFLAIEGDNAVMLKYDEAS